MCVLISRQISLQFIGSSKSCNSEGLKISDEITDAKRRKVCTGEIDVESINCVESKSSTALISADGSISFKFKQQN